MTPRNERRLWALLPLALGFLAPIIAVACIAPTPRAFITGRGLFIVFFLISTSLVPFAALSAAWPASLSSLFQATLRSSRAPHPLPSSAFSFWRSSASWHWSLLLS